MDEVFGSDTGLSPTAINFLRTQRVELNAMTSRQLIDFVEGKLKQHGIGKVIPCAETLARTYEMFAMRPVADEVGVGHLPGRLRLGCRRAPTIPKPAD
jgi:hypothetical protein